MSPDISSLSATPLCYTKSKKERDKRHKYKVILHLPHIKELTFTHKKIQLVALTGHHISLKGDMHDIQQYGPSPLPSSFSLCLSWLPDLTQRPYMHDVDTCLSLPLFSLSLSLSLPSLSSLFPFLLCEKIF